MAALTIDKALVIAICTDIESGLSNKDACYVNDISERIFYTWIENGNKAANKPPSKRTERQKLCLHFCSQLKRRGSVVSRNGSQVYRSRPRQWV